MNGISVLILACNEEKDIDGTLDSVKGLADEILVIDGGSTDRTAEIARGRGAKIVSRTFDNFTNQRQFGLSQAAGPWILSLDSDERLTPEAAEEIRQAVASNGFAGYEIPFEIVFMGRVLRFSGRGGEKHLRLFRKDSVRMAQGLSVHERYELASGRAGLLKEKIRHRPYRDLIEYMAKCEIYTDLAARDFAAKGRRLTWRFRLIPPYEFLRCFVLQLGFLDGLAGFIWAALSAYHRHVRYEKVRRIQISLAPLGRGQGEG